jgi:hypothetical protein
MRRQAPHPSRGSLRTRCVPKEPQLRAKRLAAALALAAGLALAGCGGSDGGDTTSASTSAQPAGQQQRQPQRQSGAQGRGASQGGEGTRGGASVPAYEPEIANPTPGSERAAAGVPTSRNGDNSIQLWGTESERSNLEQAAAALQDFLNARVTGSRARICATIADELLQMLAGDIATADPDFAKSGCPKLLRAAFTPAPAATRRDAAGIKVLSFRVDGDVGFVIYRDGEGKILAYPMYDDGGEWKVGLLGPTPIG